MSRCSRTLEDEHVKTLKRITYVEDEPDIRAIAQIALEEIGGFTLNVCESGHEAVATVPIFHPDMVLLDMMMPGMDGIQTFHSLRAIPELDGVPIVFMTAKAQKHEIEDYKALGAADVIPKPFEPVALSDHVRSIWERSQSGR